MVSESGNDQGIFPMNDRIAIGNDSALFILYHDDKGTFGQGQFPQGFVFPFMGLVNGNFIESQVFPVFEFMSCQYQQVACL